jgi:hypothetical protein
MCNTIIILLYSSVLISLRFKRRLEVSHRVIKSDKLLVIFVIRAWKQYIIHYCIIALIAISHQQHGINILYIDIYNTRITNYALCIPLNDKVMPT